MLRLCHKSIGKIQYCFGGVVFLPIIKNIKLRLFCKYAAYLRCRFTKNSPRRTTSTPTGVFCTLLASIPPLCKRHFQNRHGWRWFHAAAMFLLLQKLAAQHGTRMYRVERVIYITCSNRNGVNADTLSRCVLCKALYNERKFSFAAVSSLNRSTKTESL